MLHGYSSTRVWRNGKQLRLGAHVAHTKQNGGQEEGESIQWHQAAHVDDHVPIRLPILERSPNVALVKVLGSFPLSVHDEAALNTNAFLRSEEASSVGPIKDHPPTKGTYNNGRKTFENENPGPAGSTADAVHLGNGSSEKTTE
ncbi:hypothetical protein HG531_009075 [Fusarium graminearum]|nr:hypothetical protein HG531_009075 [Fusarium graminearum]